MENMIYSLKEKFHSVNKYELKYLDYYCNL